MAITETVPYVAQPSGVVGLPENSTNYFYCRTPVSATYGSVYKYVRWRWFYVRCPKLNSLCNSTSGGYVSAITVCNQQLWTNDFGQDQ